uniref:Protein sel-1 2 n=1 Tax=Sphaerodactylus townsendi TaxID=933632 RepID=A0ACB8GES2_9SAUR
MLNVCFHLTPQALGFLLSYGIGVEHDQAKAILYYNFASLGGNLMSKLILAYRFRLGINVPRSCWVALLHYKEVARFVAKRLEKNKELPVEKVRLMEKPEKQSLKTEFLDWDVYQYYKFLAERGDTKIQVRYASDNDWVMNREVCV